jgi:hypothetical protein
VFFANETVFLSFFTRYQDAYIVLTTQRPKRVGYRLEPAKGKKQKDNIRMTDQDEASDSQQSRNRSKQEQGPAPERNAVGVPSGLLSRLVSQPALSRDPVPPADTGATSVESLT